MAMTVSGVNHSISAYNRINAASQKTLQQIASGSLRPNVSMGASEYAIAVRMESAARGTSQSIRNTQNISSAIKISAGATENTVDLLGTIREQLVKASDDTNDTLDRKALQESINQSIAQIDSNARVKYNGMNMLDGSRNNLVVAGIDGYENFKTGDLRAKTLGLTDSRGNVTIDVSTPEAAKNSLKIVDKALESAGKVSESLQFMNDYVSESAALDEATTQGAVLQRLKFQEANFSTMEENLIATISNMRDTNIANKSIDFQSEQVQQQLALLATMMFNQSGARILSLLA